MSTATFLLTIPIIHLVMTASAAVNTVSRMSSESLWIRSYTTTIGSLPSAVAAGSLTKCLEVCHLKQDCDEFCFKTTSQDCFADTSMVSGAAYDSLRCYRRLCPNSAGYSLHGRRCVKLHVTPAAPPYGSNIAGTCRTESAHLFDMSTVQDAQLMRLLCNRQDATLTTLLVGVKKSGHYFLWIEGGIALPVASELWAPSQPDSSGGSKDCVQMNIETGKLSTADCSANNQFGFVCERDV